MASEVGTSRELSWPVTPLALRLAACETAESCFHLLDRKDAPCGRGRFGVLTDRWMMLLDYKRGILLEIELGVLLWDHYITPFWLSQATYSTLTY